MHELFVALAVGGTLYFLLSRRRFDYFSLAFLSADVYFMPAFFGQVSYGADGIWTSSTINPETYGIMIAVMLSILCSAWISERVKPLFRTALALPDLRPAGTVLLLMAVAGLTGLIATGGHAIFQPDKDVVLESIGRWDILFYSAAAIGFPVSLASKRPVLTIAFLALLAFDLYIGFRSAVAVAVLSGLTVYLNSQPRGRLAFRHWKLGLLVIAFGIFLFGYKYVAFAVKAGSWELLTDQLTSPDTYVYMFTRSEPFVVQQVLNEVVTHGFKTDWHMLLSSVAYQFMLFGPELGAKAVNFNDLFQPILFPEVEYGMASNIWAQMWSAGGWPLLILFLLLYNAFLALGNRSLAARSIVLRAGLAPIFVYWAFYIHRNDLGYALSLEKRSLLVLLAAAAIAWLLRAATQAGRLPNAPSAHLPASEMDSQIHSRS